MINTDFAMTKVQLSCPMGAECEYKTDEVDTMDNAVLLLQMHAKLAHQQGLGASTSEGKTGKIVRPRLEMKDSYVDEELFAFFEHRWESYKALAGISAAKAKQELGMCLSDDVSILVWGKFGPEQYQLLTEAQLMAAVKEVVVRTRNKMVTRHKLRKMIQSHDQPIQSFLSNLKTTARLCDYKVKCGDEMCGKFVDFTDQMVLEQLMVGMVDEETQRKLFIKPNITLAQAEKLVVAEEIGKLSQEDSRTVSGLSLYKQQQKQVKAEPDKKCKFCGGDQHGDGSRLWRKKKCPAFGEKCRKCDRLNHLTKQCHLFDAKPDKKDEDTSDKKEAAEAVYAGDSEEEQYLFGIVDSTGEEIDEVEDVAKIYKHVENPASRFVGNEYTADYPGKLKEAGKDTNPVKLREAVKGDHVELKEAVEWGNNPVRLRDAVRETELRDAVMEIEGGHALNRAHPAAVDGAKHGYVMGGHAHLGARPKEGLHLGVGHAKQDAGCHEAPCGGDYYGGGHAPYRAQHGVAGDEALQEVRRGVVGYDEDAYIPGIWNRLL